MCPTKRIVHDLTRQPLIRSKHVDKAPVPGVDEVEHRRRMQLLRDMKPDLILGFDDTVGAQGLEDHLMALGTRAHPHFPHTQLLRSDRAQNSRLKIFAERNDANIVAIEPGFDQSIDVARIRDDTGFKRARQPRDDSRIGIDTQHTIAEPRELARHRSAVPAKPDHSE
ncbi:MAG: hypothetical protein AAF565_05355 [Pseudomonadota bacterium]